MRLMTEDVDIDLYDVNERSSRWETVRENMQLGFLTADNIDRDDRTAVREYFAELPIVEPVDVRRGLVRVIAIGNLVEGRDWCFATTRDGTFGVFSLDEPSRTFLSGAVLHVWVPDPVSNNPSHEARMDFTDLGEYYTEAVEAMQLAA